MPASMPLDSNQMTAILIVGAVAVTLVLIAVTAIVAGSWASVSNRRSEAALKSEMIGRGMSAHEIVQVVHARTGDDRPRGTTGGGFPCASEAVVEWGGDWHQALVLQANGNSYLIHYVGNTMDENEWVDPSRIRFPAGSPHAPSAWPSDHNGAPRKAPREQEV